MTSWRKELLPSYKERRKEIKTEEASEQFERYADQLPRLLDLIRSMGVGQVRADNFEADDIAGYFSNLMPGQIVLVSNDYDWLQLVSPKVHVWRTLKGEYVTPENFTNYTECESAEEYIKTKAICGDKDEVPGVPGVGPKFAQRYLRGDLKKGKKFDAIEEWMHQPEGYDRSYNLFDLRHPAIPANAWRMTQGQFDVAAIQSAMSDLSFNSILGDFADWIDPFKKSSQA
jgi:5'-3' exonuclease